MSRTRIKICGLTRAEDALFAAECGADALGFVFWQQSPRCVTPDQAAAIVAALPACVMAVGVFVDQPVDEVRRIVTAVGLGAVQLHGDESLEPWATMPCRLFKAVGVDEAFDASSLTAWPTKVTPVLDAADPVRRGGTGRTIDWHAAARASAMRRVMLAGGLTPETVEHAIGRVAPWAVDVSSGVEHGPGVKDHGRLAAFFAAVARADARKA
jgi:phosphoribosylanthranilate isomerase